MRFPEDLLHAKACIGNVRAKGPSPASLVGLRAKETSGQGDRCVCVYVSVLLS